MRIRFFGLAAALAALVLFSPRPATAQGLASVVAANAAASATSSAEKAPICYICGSMMGVRYCQGGNAQGFNDCGTSFPILCITISPGCGGGMGLLLDPDGASQYVSRGSLLGVLASADSPPIRQNCEGVVVARVQSSDEILTVRNRTGTLSL